jgi:hypothetical protein
LRAHFAVMWAKTLICGLLSLGVSAPAASRTDSICDEELRQAEAWIQWAAQRRAGCLINSSSQEARTQCLLEVRGELSELENAHFEVYSNQIRTLHPGHPVVKNLVAKLKDNVGAAEAAILTDAKPEHIAASRRQTCLTRR